MKILLRNIHSRNWEPVDSMAYTAEHELQRLLAETPSLITISDLREGAKPLLVGFREMRLPGSGSTDILAFSPAGDIAIVECKLAANPEIKREVVAQVLEYGAFLWGMSYDDLNSRIVDRYGNNLSDLVHEAAPEEGWDEENFRVNIQANLDNGAFFLIIAVDCMNPELERTIRFLNNCGRPSFLFTALEMSRYQKGNTEILVPHLFESIPKKQDVASGTRRQWTENEFFHEVEEKLPADIAEVIQDLYQWGKSKSDRMLFGTGKDYGSYTFHHFLKDGKIVSIFSVYTTGSLQINFVYQERIAPEIRESFYQAVTKLSFFQDIPHRLDTLPSVKIKDVFVGKPQNLVDFKQMVEMFLDQIRGY